MKVMAIPPRVASMAARGVQRRSQPTTKAAPPSSTPEPMAATTPAAKAICSASAGEAPRLAASSLAGSMTRKT